MARRCVVVLALDKNGRAVMGELPNGKFKFPAGHLEPKELPKDGAIRELKEETNLDCEDLRCVGIKKAAAGDLVHFYIAKVKGVMGAHNDPDNEFIRIHLIDPYSISEKEHAYPFKGSFFDRILKI